eukprot:gene48784-biopygen39678
MSASAASKAALSGSCNATDEKAMPTTGTPSSPMEVVAAGSMRLTVVMAHDASAMPSSPPYSSCETRIGLHAMRGTPSMATAIGSSRPLASSACQNTSSKGGVTHLWARP